MRKKRSTIIGWGVLAIMIWLSGNQEVLAQTTIGFPTQCEMAEELDYPKCANSPSECGTKEFEVDNPHYDPEAEKPGPETLTKYRVPFNCIFLQEVIGGKAGYDLYTVSTNGSNVIYELWLGGALAPGEKGPVQAILTYEKGKEIEGPFTLLYNYLGLVYKFLSAIIVAIVVLMVIVAGIRISSAGGNADGVKGGKDMIIKALIGMILWFIAPVILYTINPTFFAF